MIELWRPELTIDRAYFNIHIEFELPTLGCTVI
jgi:hypothetical protein